MTMVGGGVVQSQSAFRGREDTVDEGDDTTWFALTNTNWVAPALDTNFRVRFEITLSTINANFSTGLFQLFYSHNGGSFTRVTTTSSVIKSVPSNVTGYDDDDDTTQLLSSDPTYKATNLQVNEGDNSTGSFTWFLAVGTPQYVETEWVLQLISSDLGRGDTIELRMRKGGSAAVFGGGYTYFPIISVPGAQVDIRGKEFRIDGKELAIK